MILTEVLVTQQPPINSTSPALSVRALTVRAAGRTSPILDAVAFDIPHGAIVALLGASGAGKSTLLTAIAGLVACDGVVQIHGNDVTTLGPHARNLGIAFDDALLHEHLTVRENIDSARLPHSKRCGESRDARAAIVASTAQDLEIAKLLDRSASSLSAGERRRCSIARALAREGAVILLDEPFANLDRTLRLALRSSLRRILAARHTTALIVTHDIADAIAISTYLGVLVHGQLRVLAPTADVLARPCDSAVAELLGEDAPCIAPVLIGTAVRQLGVRPTDWTLHQSPHEDLATFPLKIHDMEPTQLGAELLASHEGFSHESGFFRLRMSCNEARQLLRVGECTANVRRTDALVFGEPLVHRWGARPLLGSMIEVIETH